MRGAVHFSRLHLQFWTNRGGVDLCLNGSHCVMYGLMSFAYINIIVICKKKHRNKAVKHRQIHVIINFHYWSVSSFCDPSASCSIQVSLDTRCRLSPDEELVCFLKASWLSKIFSHLGHGKEAIVIGCM